MARSPDVLDRYVGFYVRGTNMVGTITRDGQHLLMVAPTCTTELTVESATSFVWKSVAAPGMPSFGGRGTFVEDQQGQLSGVVFHVAVAGMPEFALPYTRVDAATARTIMANNDLRAQSRTPVPGSDVAVRRLIEGVVAGKPYYQGMAPWFAELTRETTAFNEEYVRRGAVQSIEFSHVDTQGGDVYLVRQEGGTSTWIIWLGPNGVIEDADNHSG